MEATETQIDMVVMSDGSVLEQSNLLTPMPFSFPVKVNIDVCYSLAVTYIDQLQGS